MPRISFSGFTDPVRRPRYILWCLVSVLALSAVTVAALGITSTRWFCSEGCHKVQDDTITAYRHSSHSEISCMACHMPAGATPVTFVLHKAEALGELYMTVTDNYELPLNGESEVALAMPSTQCTQCHDLNKRPVTPSFGVKIDHKVHADKGINCTVCHSRVAHKEDFQLTLTNPKTGEPNQKHADFMSMTACFRCHSQDETPEGGLEAPGECSACHPAGFELRPQYHLEAGFFPEGHAKLSLTEATRTVAFERREARDTEAAAAERQHDEGGGVGLGLPNAESINECSTCHTEKFCSDCHGVPMPHPVDFKKGHGETGKKNPKVCSTCHGPVDQFCDECHHGASIDLEYTAGTAWRTKHPAAVSVVGASRCFRPCHTVTYCANCHVNGPGQQ